VVEAPNPLGVHPTSISYVFKVFHLDMLWMGIWVHPNTGVALVPGGVGFKENWGMVEPD
jgi:hypothetical protein